MSSFLLGTGGKLYSGIKFKLNKTLAQFLQLRLYYDIMLKIFIQGRGWKVYD